MVTVNNEYSRKSNTFTQRIMGKVTAQFCVTDSIGTLRSQNGNTRVCPERVVFSGAPPDQPGGDVGGSGG